MTERVAKATQHHAEPESRPDRAPASAPALSVGEVSPFYAAPPLLRMSTGAGAPVQRNSAAAPAPVAVRVATAADSDPTVQRNIAPGTALPEIDTMADTRITRLRAAANRLQDLALWDAGRAISRSGALWQTVESSAKVEAMLNDIDITAAPFRAAFTLGSQALQADVLNLFQTTPQNAPHADDQPAQAASQLRVAVPLLSIGQSPEYGLLTTAFLEKAVQRMEATPLSTRREAGGNKDVKAQQLAVDITAKANAVEPLPADKKLLLSAALKGMDLLKNLASDHRQLTAVSSDEGWLGGGNLRAQVLRHNPVDNIGVVETGLTSGTIHATVEQADRIIRTIVAPEMLASVPLPTVYVYPHKSSGFFGGFRAFANSASGVHIAQNEPVQTIVHEVGHWIEFHVPSDQWANIQALLQGRHAAATTAPNRANAVKISLFNSTEGRYGGEYGTGAYTGKAYNTGNTEVMSMTLEFLSQPAKVNSLIDADPVQVAVILQAIRPDVAAQLQDFQDYIPH